MKNTFFFIIGLVLVLSLLVWIFKPESSLNTTQASQNAIETSELSATQSAMSNDLDKQLHASNLAEIVSDESNQESFDTKSNMSIQPVDPETDPGNQIVEPTKN